MERDISIAKIAGTAIIAIIAIIEQRHRESGNKEIVPEFKHPAVNLRTSKLASSAVKLGRRLMVGQVPLEHFV